MKRKKQKYPLDQQVVINDIEWWVYVLQYENVDGTYKTIELNEKSLTEIIESAGQLS